MIPYSPLASGRLTRDWSETTLRSETDQIQKMKYDAMAEADRGIAERVAELAQKHGVPRGYRPGVAAKGGCTRPSSARPRISHLDDAVGAVGRQAVSRRGDVPGNILYVPHNVVGAVSPSGGGRAVAGQVNIVGHASSVTGANVGHVRDVTCWARKPSRCKRDLRCKAVTSLT